MHISIWHLQFVLRLIDCFVVCVSFWPLILLLLSIEFCVFSMILNFFFLVFGRFASRLMRCFVFYAESGFSMLLLSFSGSRYNFPVLLFYAIIQSSHGHLFYHYFIPIQLLPLHKLDRWSSGFSPVIVIASRCHTEWICLFT